MTFKETIATSECTTEADMVITQISNVIAFGTTAYDGAAANTAKGVPDLTNVFALSTGDRVAIKVFGGATHQFHTTVGTKHHALLTTDGVLGAASTKRSWIIMTDDSKKVAGTTAGVGVHG